MSRLNFLLTTVLVQHFNNNYILLGIFVCSIAEYFYELRSILTSQ